jgi:penicillin-binding protein 1B
MPDLFNKRPKRLRYVFWGISLFFLLAGLFAASFSYHLYSEVKNRFSSRRWSVPARVFSSTVPLYRGQALFPGQLRHILEERRYKEALKDPVLAGEFKWSGNTLVVHLRDFQFPGIFLPSQVVEFSFQQNKITGMRGPKEEIDFLELEPVEIARLYGPDRESRMLINIRQVPQHLIDAIVTIEDHRFYEHSGIDFLGVLRAISADFRAGRVVQGGSTITQQLVKNYFLESERSWRRKFFELSMALILEALYQKDDILEMYLNEIYMGRRGNVAIHGIGEASAYYFGRNVEDLTLAEAATLAGIIRAPNTYSPLVNHQVALDRRNLVLKRMLALRKISPAEYYAARLEVIQAASAPGATGMAPYFLDYVRKQAQDLYAPEALTSEGLNIYTTLQPEMASAAETAVREGLAEIEKESGADGVSNEPGPAQRLQAALIALQPKTGEIYALVGGRDYGESSSNRVLSSHREPGSAIQPFVYLAALDRFKLCDRLSDLPVTYEFDGVSLTPRNIDGRYRGRVFFREAIEQSLNAATVNLAVETGLNEVLGTLKNFGLESLPGPVASLAMGSFGVTPIELARAYAVFANDGQMPFLLSLKEIVAEDGDIRERRTIDLFSVTSPAKAFLVTSLLEGVVERGTGRVLKRLGIDFKCAGKTGTTIDFRDSWFIGYTSDLLTLVWVGYDDNSPTGLIGAQGAASIWARFMNLARPWIRPEEFDVPPGVVQEMICQDSGQLATARCKDQELEYFLTENRLNGCCTIHGR